MADNRSENWTDHLIEAVGFLIDVSTVAQTATGQTGEGPDQTRDLPGENYAEYVNYVMSAIVGPIVCFFGMAGNLVSIATWSRPGMGGSTGRYLTGQAIANFFVLLLFLLVDSIHCWFPDVMFSTAYGEFFSYVGFPIFYYSAICSIWFTVGVTVDRYIMVCWITKAQNLCNEARATLSLILISVTGFIMNIPHFSYFNPVYYETVTYSSNHSSSSSNHINHSNSSHHITNTEKATIAFAASEFQLSPSGQVFEFWIHCIILIAGPWVMVFYMNVMIIATLSKANRNMADKKTDQANKKSKESENQITRLLLTVTFTFLFFIGLMCIVQCLWIQRPPGADMMMLSTSVAFGKTALLFNSSLNVVLYCLSGRRFRLELWKMFGLQKQDTKSSSYKDSSNNTSTTSTSALSVSVKPDGVSG